MSTGLIALLDDIAALSKMAAASLDDVAGQAAKAGTKATGIVIDDAAVTPRYVVGLAAARELPIIWKIAVGSLKNKMVFLLPGALALSASAPKVITPLLMIGGAYLCLEGFHKAVEYFRPKAMAAAEAETLPGDRAQEVEEERIRSAIRTDFILSAEIMAITLGNAADQPMWTQAMILAVVGLAMTVLVYGVVAIIVKADDAGVAMAKTGSAALQGVGRAIVAGMPGFLKGLSTVGMLAMLWVGGGIVTHGLEVLGWPAAEHQIHHWAQMAGAAAPVAAQSTVEWLAGAAVHGVVGLAVGAAVDGLVRAVHPLVAKKAA